MCGRVTDTVDVIVGKVVRAHGVRGDVVVELRTDEPKLRFARGAVLGVDDAPTRQLTVKTSRAHADRLVVAFDGITTRDQAETLIGSTLMAAVPQDQRPADHAEFYDRHLVGLTALLPDGTKAGTVTEVIHGPAQDILVVRTATGERLVPFVDALVPAVDLGAGHLTVVDVPGLLDDEA